MWIFIWIFNYLNSYEPTQADNVVFEALRTAPPGDLFHAVRFFNHINSFSEAERKAFPGTRRAVDQYGPAGSVAPAAAAAPAKDDDFDLFEDDEDDAEAQRVKEERLKAYAEKKSKKPAVIAKSSVLLDIKPWDDETDMKALEESVRSINMDGLVWGSSKLVPVAYGVKKLQIQCVIEDDKVSTEALEEQVTAFEDYVQSMDIAAFNKI